MQADPTKICFGLSEEQDRISFVEFLQLAGNRKFAALLAARLSSEEIINLSEHLMSLIRQHLSEAEYHRYFLQESERSNLSDGT